MGRPSLYSDELLDDICTMLADGDSLATVCGKDGMPAWGTIHNWMNAEPEIDERITRAREVGYLVRADRAVENAKRADDAAKGRLAFDADRWYLGKLSNAFSDDKAKKLEHSGPNGGPMRHSMTVEFVDGSACQPADVE